MYQIPLDIMTGQPRADMIVRTADNAHIPADPRNSDWQAYQAWLAAGHTPAEPASAAGPDQTGPA